MDALLLAAALDTVVAMNHSNIYVHEWGVLSFGERPRACGVAGDPWQGDPAEMMADAPVVYFYGPEFTADFTVRCPGGTIIHTWPDPDAEFDAVLPVGPAASAALWEDLSFHCPWMIQDNRAALPAVTATAADIPAFYTSIPAWRAVESLFVRRAADGFADNFLYYECSLDGNPGIDLPVPGDPDVLVFTRRGGGIVLDVIPSDETSLAGPTCAEARIELDRWAGNILKPMEIEAMWRTWEPWIMNGAWEGTSLVVFPLTQQDIALISTLELAPDGDWPVFYNRFFLGMYTME
jgi:hypothetical protein